MATQKDFMTDIKPTWCPGCGNFGMWTALAQALAESGLEPHQVVMTFDIGCGANGANWHNLYAFHSLHGRSLPVANAVKMANQDLVVLASSGDGGGYGEGGNHLLHACRRNLDVTYIVHNNERYSLTTGQTSPSTKQGEVTKTSPDGAFEKTLNGLQVAISAGATFVARGYTDEISHLKDIYKKAIKHKGFSLVEVVQPCMIFYDEQNIRERYKSMFDKIDGKEWPTQDRKKAYDKAGELDRIPIGIFLQTSEPTFESRYEQLKDGPLVKQQIKKANLDPLVNEFR